MEAGVGERVQSQNVIASRYGFRRNVGGDAFAVHHFQTVRGPHFCSADLSQDGPVGYRSVRRHFQVHPEFVDIRRESDRRTAGFARDVRSEGDCNDNMDRGSGLFLLAGDLFKEPLVRKVSQLDLLPLDGRQIVEEVSGRGVLQLAAQAAPTSPLEQNAWNSSGRLSAGGTYSGQGMIGTLRMEISRARPR
jgi:hypothetical protein